MQNEILNIRREKEQIVHDKNEAKLTLMREIDEDKLKLKNLSAELDKSQQITKNLEIENNKIKAKIEELNNEIKGLTSEKYQLVTTLNHIKS